MMALLKINKWMVIVGMSLLAIHPSFIITTSSSNDSSNKITSSNMASQGSTGNPGPGQTGGPCGCRYSSDENWAINWGVASGPGGSTYRFGSGVGQSPNGGGFGFGWSSSSSTGNSNSPTPVVIGGGGGGGGSGGGGGGVNFQFGFGGGFETPPGDTMFNDERTNNNKNNKKKHMY